MSFGKSARKTGQIASSAFAKQSHPKKMLQNAAQFAVEALEGRVLLTSTWTNYNTAAPAWNASPSNWTTAFPNAASAVASLNVPTTVDENISLGTNITVGALTLGSSATGSHTQSIASGNSLTFNNGSSAAMLTTTGNGAVTIASPITLAGNLTISCGGNTPLTLSGDITTAGYSITLSNSGSVTFSGNIIGSGNIIVSKGTLTLSGSNIVSGANTYTGGITVADSTLLLSNTAGSATGSGSVTVNSAGTLGGAGSASGAVTVNNGANLTPTVGGSSILTLGSLTLASNSNYSGTLNTDTAGSGYSQVDVTGSASINSSATLHLSGSLAAHDGAALDLIVATGGVSGAFSSLAQGATTTLNNIIYTASYTAGGGDDFALTSSLASSTTTLSRSAGNITTAQSDTLTATVTHTLTGTPSGNVTFYDGSTALGTSALNGSAVATLMYSSFAAGNNQQLTAVYAGDNSFTGSTSIAQHVTVTLVAPVAPTGLTVTGATASSLVLNWIAPNAATSYSVLAEPSGGSYSTIATGLTSPTYTNTGLSANAAYSYEVKATNSVGTSPASGSASGTTLCGVPTSPTATAGGTQIALAWTAPTGGASSYNLYRSVNGAAFGGTPYQTGITPANYTDTGLTAGNTYSYEVTAVNSAGEGTATSSFGATLLPPAPTGLGATAGSGQVVLNWTAANGATGYIVYSAANGNAAAQIASGIAGTTYPDTSARAGGSYVYTLYATNAGGTSPVSASASITLAPAAPASLSITGVTASSVSLSWAASTGATSYNVLREAPGDTSYTSIATGLTAASFTDSTVASDTSYSYEVTAINAGGPSPAVGPITHGPLPSTPTGLSVPDVGSNFVDLSWNSVPNSPSYAVLRETSGGTSYSQVGLSTSGTTFEDSTVPAGTTCSYEVTATTSNGTSAATDPVSATTVPNAPASLTVAGVTSSSVSLSWPAPTGATGFIVMREGPGETTYTQDGPALTTNALNDTSLESGGTYSYIVFATDTGGTSTGSPTAIGITIPAVPSGLAVAPGDTDAFLTWTASAGATSYNIYRDDGSGGGYLSVGSSAIAGYTDTALTDGATYNYKVSAVNGGGESTASTSQSVTPSATAFANVTVTAVSTSEIDLAWSLLASGATAIEIDRSQDGINFTPITTTLDPTSTSYHDTGLADNTDYFYRLRAIIPAGNSSYTDPADAITIADVAGLSATAVSTSEIDLLWTLNVTNQTALSVYRSVDGGAYAFLTDSTLSPSLHYNSTSFADTSVVEGHDYSYELQATLPSGTSSFSDPAGASTDPVQNLAYTPTTTGVTLNWSNLSTDNTGIEVDRSANGMTYSAVATGLSGSAITSTNSGLTENTEYWYELKVTEPGGTTTSDPIAVWTLPAAATSLTVTDATDGSGDVNLGWTNNSASTVPFYIEQSTDGTNFSIIDETDAGATSYVDSNPSDGESYYRVDAVNGDATASNASGIASVINAILPPSDLTAQAVSANEIDLSWTNNSAVATGIRILGSTDGTTYTTLATLTDPTTTTYQDTSLSAGTHEYYEVEEMQGSSASAASSEADDTTIPPTPTGLAVTVGPSAVPNPTPASELDLSWTAAPGATGYDIQREATGGTWQDVQQITGGSTTTFADTELWDGIAYSYQIDAFNNAGTSDTGSAVTATTALTAPNAPVAKAVGLSPTSAEVTWINKAYNEDHFTVQRDDLSAGGGWTTLASDVTPGTDFYEDDSVPQYDEVEYRVTAVNAVGSAISNTALGIPGATCWHTVSDVQDAAELGPDGLPSHGFFEITQPINYSFGGPDSVSYTIGGTATAGTEYTALSGTVDFTAGQTNALVQVTPDEISHVEANTTLTLTVSNAGVNTFSGTHPDSTGTMNIVNTDDATVSVAAESVLLGTNDDVPISALDHYGRPYTGIIDLSSSDTAVLSDAATTADCGADGAAVATETSDAVGQSVISATTPAGSTAGTVQGVYECNIIAVYSNELQGEVANYLNDTDVTGKSYSHASGSTKSPYILMGTQAGSTGIASVRVECSVTGDPPAGLDLGLALVQNSDVPIPGCPVLTGAIGADQVVTLFSNQVTSEDAVDMHVCWGFDKNQDGLLSPSEIHAYDVRNRVIKVVGPAAQAAAKTVLEAKADTITGLVYPVSANWLYAFLNDQGLANAANAPGTISTGDPQYDHHVGAVFTTGQTAPINVATFATDSPVANEIYGDFDMSALVKATILSDLPSIISTLGTTGESRSFSLPIPSGGGIDFKEGDLHYSIGYANTSLKVTFNAVVDNGSYLKIGATITGQITDLYDFWIGAGGISVPAAYVEAGYTRPATLTHPADPGHIFKEVINLNGELQKMTIPLP